MYKTSSGQFDVDEFLKEEDTFKIFENYRKNNPHEWDYIKILFKQAYVIGSIDASILKF